MLARFWLRFWNLSWLSAQYLQLTWTAWMTAHSPTTVCQLPAKHSNNRRPLSSQYTSSRRALTATCQSSQHAKHDMYVPVCSESCAYNGFPTYTAEHAPHRQQKMRKYHVLCTLQEWFCKSCSTTDSNHLSYPPRSLPQSVQQSASNHISRIQASHSTCISLTEHRNVY